MNSTSYKDLVNSRGYKYHYYNVPARGDKPTLVFVHGFPNTSHDWRHLAPFFESRGCGVIAPDMLAYGGTDKPTDPEEYQYSLLGKDIVDILDAENVKQAIAIGHDWGSFIVSRLGNFFPERFMAYANFSIPYALPMPDFTMEAFTAYAKQHMGYEPYGYMHFLAKDGIDKLIENNLDTFLCTVHPKDMGEVKGSFIDGDGLSRALSSDWKAPLADYFTEEDKRVFMEAFSKGGMAAPLCYYKILVSGGRASDDATVPADRLVPPVSSPIFFGAALRDRVCNGAMGRAMLGNPALKNHNITIRDFDGNHWILLVPEIAEAVNRELLAWIEDVVVPGAKTTPA